jgi:hypothetical protein
MTTRRAVTYGGLTCLLAAWLASAASTSRQAAPPEQPARGTSGPSTDTLAVDVQEHATRLRERLAAAPNPQLPRRNPFLFESRPSPPSRQAARPPEPVAIPELQPAPEPVLSLIGIAEDRGAQGPIRTAVIAGDADELFMVTAGQTVLRRYRVEAIGADVVELKDIGTGVVRRLALR